MWTLKETPTSRKPNPMKPYKTPKMERGYYWKFLADLAIKAR